MTTRIIFCHNTIYLHASSYSTYTSLTCYFRLPKAAPNPKNSIHCTVTHLIQHRKPFRKQAHNNPKTFYTMELHYMHTKP